MPEELPAHDCSRCADDGALRGRDPPSRGTDGRAPWIRVPRPGAFVGRAVRHPVLAALRSRSRQPGRLARALHHRRLRGGTGGRPARRGGAGDLRLRRLRAGGDRYRALAGRRPHRRLARHGPVRGRRARPGRPAAGALRCAGVRGRQRPRAGGGGGVGGGVSDGELEEGQVWEAALFAAHNRLGSLTVLLDANDSQVDGPVSSITTLEPIAAKWESFGWAAFDVDGHDSAAIDEALSAATADPRPAVVIGRTSTSRGLSVLPDGADGHFIKLPAPLAEAAIKELEARLA